SILKDTLYTSIIGIHLQDFLKLIANKTSAIGAVCDNRKNVPNDLVEIKLKKR
ncbi:unnamed protein product, partial [Heterotrigona itama]